MIPGYGFLSENSAFAKSVSDAGMVWVGPAPASIDSFGIKHTARELADNAGVPIVPGSNGLIENGDDAVKQAEKLGYPVMLKATAGGGGMGLSTCQNTEEIREAFETVRSRGETLFKNSGVFMERFYPDGHHIEVQVFGNGKGNAIHFGERECSIQRRHQKVIEECPSPFVEKHPGLREKLCAAAVTLTESIKYASAGTIEYLVDDNTADFFFLEMNTRLQVEHGITELCYDVDLVQLMLEQADAQLLGKGGIAADKLISLQPNQPKGAAIEVRVYAENPARDYVPSPGTLQIVEWKALDGSRLDTWVRTGSIVSSHYDPLLAKLMFHGPTREKAIEGMHELLTTSHICGPPTNLDFLASIIIEEKFKAGDTMTKFLRDFNYAPSAIDVISCGAYTTIQDYPGRPTMGRGFPHAGPMDPLAFQIANLLVGNSACKEALEITLEGPELLFLGPAVIALCGAPMELKLDGKSIPMWSRTEISERQRLKIGKTTGGGCRSYLAVHGGFPGIAEWFGSKATSPGVGVGGYQGRALASGDLLSMIKDLPEHVASSTSPVTLPDGLVPSYPSHWSLAALPGPYDHEYLTCSDISMIYETKWQISHNAARGGIRLIGPKPQWARKDGGEGGAHPSNVAEYGYPVGTLNWTGDEPCIFPVDCPDFGGFVSSTTIVRGEWWRLGQMKAGDTLEYRQVSLDQGIEMRKRIDHFIDQVAKACAGEADFDGIESLDYDNFPLSATTSTPGQGIIHQIGAKDKRPLTTYRQGGDDYVLVEYGHGEFDLNHRCRVTALTDALKKSTSAITFSSGLVNTVGCCNSLLIYYDGLQISQHSLVSHLTSLENSLGDLSKAKMPSRIFKLPITFDTSKEQGAIKRYMETQRPYASYLPDNMDFVAKNNGLEKTDLKKILLGNSLMAISVGFFAALPLCLPVDPRKRIYCPKMNPSRVFTPEGQVSWGGACMALYNVESPGGYQLTGLTIPGVDILGSKQGYLLSRPWLFEDFDQLTFHEIPEQEYEEQLAIFHSGRYEYRVENTIFDMEEHNRLLQETREEVKEIRKKQAEAQMKMAELEAELMAKWDKEKTEGKIPMDKVEALLNGKFINALDLSPLLARSRAKQCYPNLDPSISKVSSPLNANVWKITASEGDVVEANQVVTILEAMKLEIAVRTEEDVAGGKVEKLLVRPNDVVKAGDPILLVRKKGH